MSQLLLKYLPPEILEYMINYSSNSIKCICSTYQELRVAVHNGSPGRVYSDQHELILTPHRASDMDELRYHGEDTTNLQHLLNHIKSQRITIRRLYLTNPQFHDVQMAVSCTRLHVLDLSNTSVTDISHLEHCKQLKELDLSWTQVCDASVLGKLSKLEKLSLKHTDVEDVSYLSECIHLKWLSLAFAFGVSGFTNPSPRLQYLNIAHTDILYDVSPLYKCKELKTLYITHGLSSNDYVNLHENCPLVDIKMWDTDISYHHNLKQLASHSGLDSLHKI